MANQTPLANWLYSKRAELNPRFKEFNWPSKIFPGVFDFETKISWGDIEADGRGVDPRREIALEKSVAEAIERLICKTLGFDSVGFAVAATHDPSQHAKFESLERFYLNRHLESSIPFSKIEYSFAGANILKASISSAAVGFYRMKTPENLFGLVCRIHSNDSTSFGFALSNSLDISAQRSFLESIPSFAWMISDESSDSVELPWQLQTEFVNKMNHLIKEKTNFENDNTSSPELRNADIDISTLSVLNNAPLNLARYLIDGPK